MIPIHQESIPILAQRGLMLAPVWELDEDEEGADSTDPFALLPRFLFKAHPELEKKKKAKRYQLQSLNYRSKGLTFWEKATCHAAGGHEAPHPRCNCGFYAVPYEGDGRETDRLQQGNALAHVELSGRIIECGKVDRRNSPGMGSIFPPLWIARNLVDLYNYFNHVGIPIPHSNSQRNRELDFERMMTIHWLQQGGAGVPKYLPAFIPLSELVKVNWGPERVGAILPPEPKTIILGYRAQVQRILAVDITLMALCQIVPHAKDPRKAKATMSKVAVDNPRIDFNLVMDGENNHLVRPGPKGGYACITYRAGDSPQHRKYQPPT